MLICPLKNILLFCVIKVSLIKVGFIKMFIQVLIEVRLCFVHRVQLLGLVLVIHVVVVGHLAPFVLVGLSPLLASSSLKLIYWFFHLDRWVFKLVCWLLELISWLLLVGWL